MLIGAITAIAVVGVGLIVAAFSKTVSQAFIIANFPLIFFMFFSGAVYPLPRIRLFEVAGRVITSIRFYPSYPRRRRVEQNTHAWSRAARCALRVSLTHSTFSSILCYRNMVISSAAYADGVRVSLY